MGDELRNAPIGVFDSGLGGLTVASAIVKALPKERLIYLGDTARVPYGTRSPATVVRYARKNVAFLRQNGIKAVVVACNTVSAQGLGGLADGVGLPFLGVIRPGAQAALKASSGGDIAVLGTPATVRSDAYRLAIHEMDPRRTVLQVPCPLFVPLIEEGWLDHDVTRAVAREYLSPLRGTDVDTVILGCTHYPLLRALIAEILEEMMGTVPRIVDSATAVADSLGSLLEQIGRARSVDHGEHIFYVTDAPDRVAGVANQFWDGSNEEGIRLQHIDLFDPQ